MPQQSETVQRPSVDGSSTAVVQAAWVACRYLENTRQAHRNKSFEVFWTLASRTLERAPLGLAVQFSAQNLKAEVAPEASKEASGWLSPLWKRLTSEESQWQEGLIDTAREFGLAFIPKLGKQSSSPALYFLEPSPIPADVSAAVFAPLPERGVRYTAESVAAPAAWLSAALKSGVVRWTGGLRWTVAGILVLGSWFALGLTWLFLNQSLKVWRPLSLGDLISVAVFAGAVAAMILIYRFMGELFDLRIVIAPDILTPFSKKNVTLEMRPPVDDGGAAALVFARYSAVCPHCDGQVVVDFGRKEFPDRLVGRCGRSPREHVFSFDHVLRVGASLRHSP